MAKFGSLGTTTNAMIHWEDKSHIYLPMPDLSHTGFTYRTYKCGEGTTTPHQGHISSGLLHGKLEDTRQPLRGLR
jgi:hypothetical protein